MSSVTSKPATSVVAFARLGLFVLVVAVLWIARDILIPTAISVLLAFILMPVVSRVERLGAPRWLAVPATVTAAGCVIALVGWIVVVQALDFGENLPRYRGVAREKFLALAGETDGVLARARRGLDEVERQVSDAASALDDGSSTATPESSSSRAAPSTRGTPHDSVQPLDVSASDGPVRYLSTAVSAAMTPLLGIGIVVLLTTFILLRREELRDRIVALAGQEQLHRTTDMMDAAATQLGRLLLAQFLVSVGFAVLFAGGLLMIGIPNALLFGALVVPLRFVPVVGPWISMALPTALAMIVLDGWFPPIATVSLFVVLEVVTSYVIEPWALGKRTGMSMSAVLLSLMFWTWLWGAPGLVLAMPMTTSLAVLGRRVRALEWMATLLNEETGLPASARLYQRLLALDFDKALAVARSEPDTGDLERTYGEVMMPALAALERDRQSGELGEEPARVAMGGMSEIVDTLALDSVAAAPSERRTVPRRIVLLPAQTEADSITARMLMHVARGRGQEAQALPVGDLTSERAAAATGSNADVICICAMPPLAEAHARLLIERMRDGLQPGQVVVALWQRDIDARTRERLEAIGARGVVTSFDDAIRTLVT